MNVSKDAHVKFQAEHVGNIYMLRNLEVTVDGWQLSSASRSEVLKQSVTMKILISDVQSYLEDRLGLDGASAQQGSP